MGASSNTTVVTSIRGYLRLYTFLTLYSRGTSPTLHHPLHPKPLILSLSRMDILQSTIAWELQILRELEANRFRVEEFGFWGFTSVSGVFVFRNPFSITIPKTLNPKP